MRIFEHLIPIGPGETITDFPKADDPRMKPFLDGLIESGVMSKDGTCLKPCTMRRGAVQNNFVIQVELKGADA